MNIRKGIYNLVVQVLSFIFVVQILEAVTMPKNIIYWLMVTISVGFALMMYEPLLRFFTVKSNFLTQWLSMAILSGIVLYLLELFVAGFYINEIGFDTKQIQIITINSFTISKIGTIIVVAALTSLVSSFLEALRRSD